MKTPEEILKDFGITDKTKHHNYNYLYKSAILAMKMYAEQKLKIAGVMQAEGSDGAQEAAVGQRSVGTNAACEIVDKALSEISDAEFVKAAEKYFGGGARKSSEGHL